MAYFDEKTIRKKKAAALLLYIQLEHDKKIPAGATSSLTGIRFVYYSVFKAAPVFFSDRLTHCRIRQTSVLTRTVLCQFHAKDGFKVLANYHHEA